jgi:hypothetical protein
MALTGSASVTQHVGVDKYHGYARVKAMISFVFIRTVARPRNLAKTPPAAFCWPSPRVARFHP